MGTSGQRSKLSSPVLAFLIIMDSFVAGLVITAGVLKKQSGYDWMLVFAVSLLFLVAAIDHARQLLRRTAEPEVR